MKNNAKTLMGINSIAEMAFVDMFTPIKEAIIKIVYALLLTVIPVLTAYVVFFCELMDK